MDSVYGRRFSHGCDGDTRLRRYCKARDSCQFHAHAYTCSERTGASTHTYASSNAASSSARYNWAAHRGGHGWRSYKRHQHHRQATGNQSAGKYPGCRYGHNSVEHGVNDPKGIL